MNIIIIGNGISGITCARSIRKKNSDATITVISEESEHFYSRTALMYIYMGHMKYENTKPYEDWFWSKNRISLIKASVVSLDTAKKSIQLKDNGILFYDKLVLATGSIPNKFGCPGENLKGVQGLYSLQDLEKMDKNTSNITAAVIVGGGLIGIRNSNYRPDQRK
jgi:NAD(P)H-nitrite reductase large subunit